jgi:ribosome-associated protein
MEETQEKLLHRERVKIEINDSRTPFADLDDEVKLAIRCALDKKAENMVVLDLREIASFAEFFVIASGNNQRQVQAVADEIAEQLKKLTDGQITDAFRAANFSPDDVDLMKFGFKARVEELDKATRQVSASN